MTQSPQLLMIIKITNKPGSFNDLKGRIVCTRKTSGQISLENAKQTQTGQKRKKPKHKQNPVHNNKCSPAHFCGGL